MGRYYAAENDQFQIVYIPYIMIDIMLEKLDF